MKIEPIIYMNKRIGTMIGSLTYVSHRSHAKHLFRGGRPTVASAIAGKTAAWGVNDDILKLLASMGIKVVIVEADGKIYYSSIKKIEEKAIYLDMGHGLQRFLMLNDWQLAESTGDVTDAISKIARRLT